MLCLNCNNTTSFGKFNNFLLHPFLQNNGESRNANTEKQSLMVFPFPFPSPSSSLPITYNTCSVFNFLTQYFTFLYSIVLLWVFLLRKKESRIPYQGRHRYWTWKHDSRETGNELAKKKRSGSNFSIACFLYWSRMKILKSSLEMLHFLRMLSSRSDASGLPLYILHKMSRDPL